jgi:protein-disulfide isomerase
LVYHLNGQSNINVQKIAAEAQIIFAKWQDEEVIDLKITLDEDLSQLDFYYGDKDAPHTIVVWTDFECPFCRITTHALMSYIDNAPEKLKMVFKNYPLDIDCNSKLTKDLHANACAWAKLARCAGLDGVPAFWNEYDKITRFKAYSPDKKYALCAANNAVVSRKLQSDIIQGIGLNLNTTPTIYLDGKRLNNLTVHNMTVVLGLIVQ